MTRQAVFHATFTIERVYPVTPAKVFKAWADPAAKGKWFVGPPGVKDLIREYDFRVGGGERAKALWPEGRTSDFVARYHDIVPDQRIIYAYDMFVSDKKLSVSLATILLDPVDQGTKLTFTEQGAFFDDPQPAHLRETGSGWMLDNLGKWLQGAGG